MQLDIFVIGVITSVISFWATFITTPFLIKHLIKIGWVVNDVNKNPITKVPRGGISIYLGLIIAGINLYLFLPSVEILAVLITVSIAFLVGMIDDRKTMGGYFKPVGLVIAALPIILLGAYNSDLLFPLFGEVSIPILYLGLVVLMIPITGNTINSIDVANGVASGFMILASLGLGISLVLVGHFELSLLAFILFAGSLAFYHFHKLPSKIFPSDSGVLVWGAMYGGIAIVGQVEIVALIIILPAVINSFLFLSSTKKIVEHKEIKAKGVENINGLLTATKNPLAPVTLVRMIVAKKPLTEKQVGEAIFNLTLYSSVLGMITALLSGYTL